MDAFLDWLGTKDVYDIETYLFMYVTTPQSRGLGYLVTAENVLFGNGRI